MNLHATVRHTNYKIMNHPMNQFVIFPNYIELYDTLFSSVIVLAVYTVLMDLNLAL